MKPEGSQYRDYISEQARQSGKDLWVGLTDRAVEGVWRFPTDRSYFDPNDGQTLFRWHEGEPNNTGKDQECAKVYYHSSKRVNGLDDDDCSKEYHGLCEVKVFDC